MSANVTIPNSYQTPNIVVDKLYQYLKPDEIVVLTFAIRHILGWRDKIADRRGCISLSVFEHGFTTQREVNYGGCGLTRPRISRALKALVDYGIMAKVGEATQDGQEWALTFDTDNSVNWNELEHRRANSQKKSSKRVAKAAKASAEKRKLDDGSTTAVPPKVVRQPYRKGYDSRTTGSTTAVHIQTYANTHQTHVPPSAGATAPNEPSPPDVDTKITKPVQPHIAIIDAWYDAMPAAPIVRSYPRNAKVAKAIVDAEYTPEQVTAFVRSKYAEDYWQGKQMPLEVVAKDLPQWVVAHPAPPEPIRVVITDAMLKRNRAEHLANIRARVEAGEFGDDLREVS